MPRAASLIAVASGSTLATVDATTLALHTVVRVPAEIVDLCGLTSTSVAIAVNGAAELLVVDLMTGSVRPFGQPLPASIASDSRIASMGHRSVVLKSRSGPMLICRHADVRTVDAWPTRLWSASADGVALLRQDADVIDVFDSHGELQSSASIPLNGVATGLVRVGNDVLLSQAAPFEGSLTRIHADSGAVTWRSGNCWPGSGDLDGRRDRLITTEYDGAPWLLSFSLATGQFSMIEMRYASDCVAVCAGGVWSVASDAHDNRILEWQSWEAARS